MPLTASVVFSTLSIVAYIICFFVLFALFGHHMPISAVLPVTVIAWLYGMIAGTGAALISFPVNILFYKILGIPWYTVMIRDGNGIAGTAVLIIIGAIVGRIRDLNSRLHQELAERREAETALKNSEERFRRIGENIEDGLTVIENGKVVFVNERMHQIIGDYNRDTKIITNHDIIYPEDRVIFENMYTEYLKTGMLPKQIELRIIRNDGAVRYVQNRYTQCSKDEKTSSVYIITTDVTEERTALQALRESEGRYRAVIETATDAIITIDSSGTIITWNRAAEHIFGYTASEIEGQSLTKIIPRPAHMRHEQNFSRALMPASPPIANTRMEGKGLRKDGNEFPLEISISSWQIAEHRYFTSIVRDITERKKNENSIRESQEFLKNIFKTTPDPIIVTDEHGCIRAINDAVTRHLGYTEDDLIGKQTGILTPEEPRYRQRIKELLDDFFEKGYIANEELPVRGKSGALSYWEWNSIIQKDDQENITGSIAVLRDIRERKKIEDEMRQSQKMEAIGTLAGGIAHDFNNILAAIMGYAELTIKQFPGENSIKQNLEVILKSSLRAKDLIKQILTFCRKAEQEQKPILPYLIIKEAIKLLRASIPATISIRENIDKQSGIIMADPTQVHQILVNLCTNAAQAMQEAGGVLEIVLKPVTLDKAAAKQYPDLPQGEYVMLSVRDTGCGIDPVYIDRIYDPFFTTKEAGKGTGMGLAVVHGIVKSHNGAISVQSETGKGTLFQVLLPRVKEESRQIQEKEEPVPIGTERILFIDDEITLIGLAREMLSSLGYKVTAVQDSRQALELFKSDTTSFDVIITDQTMPDMTGFDLAQQVLAVRPDMPIILCTGYSDIVSDDKVKAAGIREFIIKPLRLHELAATIRRAIAQQPLQRQLRERTKL